MTVQCILESLTHAGRTFQNQVVKPHKRMINTFDFILTVAHSKACMLKFFFHLFKLSNLKGKTMPKVNDSFFHSFVVTYVHRNCMAYYGQGKRGVQVPMSMSSSSGQHCNLQRLKRLPEQQC